MNGPMFFWLALGGLLLNGLAAIGTKVLNDFSRHELEVYCRRRKRPQRFDEIMDHHDEIAVGSQALQIVGATILVVCLGFWLAASSNDQIAPNEKHLIATIVVSTILLLATTSWIPLAVVQLWSAPFLYHTWRIWRMTNWLLWPLTVGAKIVDALMRRLAGRLEEAEDEEEAFEDEIRTIVADGQYDGLLERDAREMIEGVIALGDADVSHIMTPRSRIDAIDIRRSWSEVLQFVTDCRRTRVPVYEENLDNVIGILYVKDLLSELASPVEEARKPLRQLLRPAIKIPASKALDDMLQQFRDTHNHLAIVQGEYGEVAGLVTIEDILEEIVGEIVDEHDAVEEAAICIIDEATVDASGRAYVDDLNEEFGVNLPAPEDYNTIAGLVVNQFGYIPKPGESFELDDVRITVTEANPRRVERVRLEMIDHDAHRETA